MSIVWGNETVLHLIELYQSYGLLWDTANRDYRNKLKKNYAWDDIAKALNIPKKEIENKIHTLRSQFIQEKKKVKSSKTTGSGGDDVKPSSWFAYDAMKFLLKGATTSGSVDTLETSTQQSQESIPESPNAEALQEDNPATVDLESQVINQETPQAIRPSTCQICKRTLPNEDKMDEAYEVMRFAKSRMLAQDEFSVYGQYVASELREVTDTNSILMAKHYINNILIDAHLGQYHSGLSSQSTEHHSYSTTSIYASPQYVDENSQPAGQRNYDTASGSNNIIPNDDPLTQIISEMESSNEQ